MESTVKLLGNNEEAFFQLGLKNKEVETSASRSEYYLRNFFHQMDKLLPWSYILDKTTYPKFNGYAQGANTSVEAVLWRAMSVEAITPPTQRFNITTAFTLHGASYVDSDNQMLTRLIYNYNTSEELLSYTFSGHERQLISVLANRYCPLVPYFFSNRYLSFSIHHAKEEDSFKITGTMLAILWLKLAEQAYDLKKAKKILEESKSMSPWIFFITDTNANTLKASIHGDRHHFEFYSHQDQNQPLYCLDEGRGALDQKTTLFFKYQDELRHKTMLNWLKVQKKWSTYATKAKKLYQLPSKNAEALSLSGPHCCGVFMYQITKHDWLLFDHQNTDGKSKDEGLDLLTQAFKSYSHDQTAAYHYIQKSLSTLPRDSELWGIAKFFFLCWQLKSAKFHRDYQYLYLELQDVRKNLIWHLYQHSIVLSKGLSLWLEIPFSDCLDASSPPHLQKVYQQLQSRSRLSLKIFFKTFNPNPKLLDIAYPLD